jgi:PAS domain S-box-containing protein
MSLEKLTKAELIEQLKASKDEIEKSTLHFRDFLDQAPLCYQSLDENGDFVDVNQTFLDALGYKRTEIIGKNFADILTKDSQKKFKVKVEKFKAGGLVNEAIFDMVRKDGPIITVSLNGRITFDKNGFLKTHCLFKNITSQIQAQSELRNSEKQFRLLAESIQDVYWLSTPGVTKMVYVSPMYEKMWGKSCASLYKNPRSFTDRLHPDDLDNYLAIIDKTHAKLIKYQTKYRIITPKGNIRWIHERGFPAHDDEKQELLMAGVCTDITEQVKLQEQVKLASAKWKSTFDTISDAIALLDKDQRIIRINQSMEKMFPDQTGKIIGKYCWQVIHGTNRPTAVSPVIRMQKSLSREVQNFEINDRIYETSVDPILNGSNVPVGAVHTMRDITKRKQMEIALQNSERQFRNLYQNALVALFSVTIIDKKVITANKVAADLFGYSSIEEFKNEFQSFKHYANLEDRGPVLKELKEKGFIDKILISSKKKDGTVIWNEGSFRLNADGVLDCVAVDVTEKIKAEKELNFRARILSEISDAVIVTNNDKNFTISHWNKAAENIYQWTKHEVVGKSAKVLNTKFAEKDKTKAIKAITNDGSFRGDVTQQKKDGSKISVESNLSSILDDSGSIIGWVSINRDVSVRKKTAKALGERMKELECLYAITELKEHASMAPDDFLTQAVNVLPPGGNTRK